MLFFCLDRAGIAGADGPTHHGAYDIAYMRCIPNIIVSAPMNEEELRNLMYTAQLPNKGPFSIRYPRGKGVMTDWKTPFKEIKIGTGRKIKNGNDIAILSLGQVGNYAVEACSELNGEGIDVAHYDMRFAKPLDSLLLHEVFGKFDKIITLEDGCIIGGIGSAIIEFMADNGYSAQINRLGIPDKYIEHGTQDELHLECNYDKSSILMSVKMMMGIKNNTSSKSA
jgi:1-deoxy-D-xylulose-5-phosphate synthase